MREPKIIFFLAVWKRPEITELCFMGLQRLMKHCGGSALAIISEKSIIPLCKKYGIDFCEHENEPLGAKKNFGLNEVMKKDFDYLFELGSDDIILNDIFDLYKPYFDSKEPIFGSNKFLHVDTVSGDCRSYEALEGKYGRGWGLGRCMSKELLERTAGNKIQCIAKEGFATINEAYAQGEIYWLKEDHALPLSKSGLIEIQDSEYKYKLWTDKAIRNLDNDSNGRIMANGFKYKAVSTPEPLMADFKSDENIWGFNPELGDPGNLEKFLSGMSKQEKEYFFQMQKKLKAKRIETRTV